MVKTINNNVKKEAGIQKFVWDGSTDDWSYEEPFTYMIQAKTGMGNENKAIGSIIPNNAEQYPEWIQNNAVSTYGTSIDIVTNVTKEHTELQLTVYHSYYGDLANYYDRQTYTLKKGNNTLNYLVPADKLEYPYGYLVYALSYKDELGNVYSYNYTDWYSNY